MLEISGRAVIFSQSFTLRENEEAVINEPDLEGLIIRIRAGDVEAGKHAKPEDILSETTNDSIAISLPFIQENRLSFEKSSIGKGPLPQASLRLTAHGTHGLMTVHLDVFATPARF